MRGLIQRCNQWLDDRQRAVPCAAVIPCLKEMRTRNVPRCQLPRLVAVETNVDRHTHVADGFGEVEIGREAVPRVRAEHQQKLDPPGLHVLYERRHRLRERRNRDSAGVEVLHHVAAELRIQRRAQSVDLHGLRRAGHKRGVAAGGPHILNDGLDHRVAGKRARSERSVSYTKALPDGRSHVRDVARAECLAVVSHAARARVRALEGIEAAHRTAHVHVAACCVLPTVPDTVRILRTNKVGVEGDDYICAGELVMRAERSAEGGLRAQRRNVVAVGVQLDPPGAGKTLLELLLDARLRGGRRRLGNHRDRSAVRVHTLNGREKLIPRRGRAIAVHRARAVGVVEV